MSSAYRCNTKNIYFGNVFERYDCEGLTVNQMAIVTYSEILARGVELFRLAMALRLRMYLFVSSISVRIFSQVRH